MIRPSLAYVLAAGVAAPAFAIAGGPAAPAPAAPAVATAAPAIAVPAAVAAPAGSKVVAEADASGTQNYVCKGQGAQFAWSLAGPDATLRDARGDAGTHGAGPTWQWRDGSKIAAALVAKADAPGASDIPWLLLRVTRHDGKGVLAPVRFVQRLATRGGRAPASGCDSGHAGSAAAIPYSARYVFLD